jgi:Tfp pilus assembly protein FimT
MRGRSRRGGFTLVELAVALGVAVVAMGIVVVRVDGWSNKERLKASARTLGNLIRTHRERAEAEERIYVLEMNLEKGEYAFSSEGELIRKGMLPPGQAFGRVKAGEVVLPSPVRLAFGPKAVLPEIEILLQGGEKELVSLTLGSWVNEVSYAQPQ